MALSPQEFETLKAHLVLNKNGEKNLISSGMETPKEGDGFLSRVATDLKKRAGNAFETIKESPKLGGGPLGLANPGTEAGLQIMGQQAGTVNDILGEATKSILDYAGPTIKSIIPESVKKELSPAIHTGIDALSKGAEMWKKFEASQPRMAKDISSFVNIMSLYPGGKAAGGTVKVAEGAANTVEEISKKTAGKMLDPIQETLAGIDTPTKAILDPALNAEAALGKKVAEGSLTKEGAAVKLKNVEKSVKPKALSVKQESDDYLKIARRGAIDHTQPSALDHAGTKAESAVEIMSKKLDRYGKEKSAELAKVANQEIPGVDEVKMKLLEGLDSRVGAYIDEAGDITNAPGKVSKIALDPADQKLLKDTYKLINNLKDSDTALRLDGTVDALQNLLYKRTANIAIPVNGSVEGLLKEITGELNNLVKIKAGKKYIIANQRYTNVVDLRDKLNKALGIDASKGGALMKRVFSPADGGTKKLFNKIKDITGVDLTKEAVLAKYAMEAIGDARSSNLLEQLGMIKGILTGGSGKIDMMLNALLKKSASKEKVGQKILEKSVKR